MEFDLEEESGVNDFVTVPNGTYLCEVAEVRVGTTKAGDPRWGIRLIVAEGEHVGKQAAWDGLVFSTRGRARARQILGAMGLPNKGKVDIEPHDLEGRRALVEVRPTEFQHPQGGVIRRNEVPYDGYQPVPEDHVDNSRSERGQPGRAQLGAEAMEDIPF